MLMILLFQEDVRDFAYKIANIVKSKTRFYAIDIARKADGGLICVELNCGTMSGLSTIQPDDFYKNLKRIVINALL